MFKCLDYLSKELSNKQQMSEEELWEVFHICADTAAIYRHITDYFSTLDKLIFDARLENSKLKQELYDLKKLNIELQDKVDRLLDGI